MRSAVSVFSGVVAASAVMVGSGCQACNDIGCSDQVVFVEVGELPTSLLPFDIVTCVDGLCHERPYIVTEQNSPMVPVGLEVPAAGIEKGDMVTVTLKVSSQATGEVLLETSGSSSEAVRYRAGGDCGPTCTNASLTLDRASGLLVGPTLPD